MVSSNLQSQLCTWCRGLLGYHIYNVWTTFIFQISISNEDINISKHLLIRLTRSSSLYLQATPGPAIFRAYTAHSRFH